MCLQVVVWKQNSPYGLVCLDIRSLAGSMVLEGWRSLWSGAFLEEVGNCRACLEVLQYNNPFVIFLCSWAADVVWPIAPPPHPTSAAMPYILSSKQKQLILPYITFGVSHISEKSSKQYIVHFSRPSLRNTSKSRTTIRGYICSYSNRLKK